MRDSSCIGYLMQFSSPFLSSFFLSSLLPSPFRSLYALLMKAGFRV